MPTRLTTLCLCCVLVFCLLFPALIQQRSASAPATPESGAALLPAQTAHAPAIRSEPTAAFTENLGQVPNPDVLFYAASGSMAFASDSVFIYTAGGAESGASGKSVLRLCFPGCNAAGPEGSDPLPWKSNFFIGQDEGSWHSGVPNYRAVVYRNLWDGIDLTYMFVNGSVKYEFSVAPGADPGLIRIKAEGAEALSVSDSGLEMELGNGRSITDAGLDVFYTDAVAEKIQACFTVLSENMYSFSLGRRDMSRPMTIDPLIYSTFIGGTGYDRPTDVAVGTDGCAYTVGYTDSLDFPTSFGAYVSVSNPESNVIFVTKMGLNGDSVVYTAMMGGESHDFGKGIAVDSEGNAYITGYTMSQHFPTTQGAFSPAYNGDTYDSFVAKFSPLGDSLIYSTYLGGSAVDCASAIAVDGSGSAYIVGDTWSQNFPISSDAAMRSFNGGSTGANDGFVTKLNRHGSSIEYSTYLGHADYDYANDIAVDSNGYAFITGQTRSAMFPATSRAFDRTHNGGYDAFAAKLSQTGTSFMYCTFIGGSSADYGNGIAVGAWGTVYVTGSTVSTDFPTTEGAYDISHNGGSDAFVTMLDRYGESLAYSTFLGGANADSGVGISLDSYGCAAIAGHTASPDYPMAERGYDRTHNGGTDAFMSKLSASGAHLLDSTFLGGPENDYAWAIAAGQTGFAHIVGETFSPAFPASSGAADISFGGNSDGFVTKLDIAPPVADAGQDMLINEGQTATFTAAGSTDNHGIVNFTWTFTAGQSIIEMYGISPQRMFPVPGIYTVTLNVTDASGYWDTDTAVLTVWDITHPTADAGPDIVADEDTAVQLSAAACSDNVGIVNYTWSFTERYVDKVLYGQTPSYVFATPGNYAITLKIWDAAGNWAVDTVSVLIYDITAPTARAGPDRSLYSGNETWFDGAASRDNVDITSYTWFFSDGTADFVLQGAQVRHFFSVPGTYPVRLTVTDTSGLTGTDTMVLTVLETSSPAADAGPDMTVNEAETALFDGSGCTDNIGVASWVWSFNDGLNSITLFGRNPSWIFTVPGTYQVTLNASDAAGNWALDTMTVTVLDTMPPIAAPGANRIILPGTSAEFDGSRSYDSSGIANFTWTFVYNGTEITLFGQTQSFLFWTEGTYTVTLTVLDANGNSAEASIAVTVAGTEAVSSSGWRDSYGWALLLPACIMLAATAMLRKRKGQGAGRP